MNCKKISQFILVFIVLLGSFQVFAAGVPRPGTQKMLEAKKRAAFEARFSASERSFFKRMTLAGANIVRTKIEEAEAQYNCITKYLKDPTACPMGREALFSVKEAYNLYQKSYLMANHKEVMRNYTLAPGGIQFMRLATPFSRKTIRVDMNEVDHLRQLRQADEDFVAKQTADCKFTMDDKQKFYNMQLGQIVTNIPVVLFIDLPSPDFMTAFGMGSKHETLEDQDVLDAYQELLDNFDQTYDQFMQYKQEDYEDLIVYQMLANKVVQTNPKYWGPIHEGLNIKLLPQTNIESTLLILKNVIFSLNTLFIGCAIISAGTGFPYVALACTAAAAANQGSVFLNSIKDYNDYYREWVSGVRDWESVSTQKLKIQVDFLLTLINVYALKGFVSAIPTDKLLQMSAWASSIRESSEVFGERATQQFLTDYLKEMSVDNIRGELAVPYVFSLGYRQIIEMRDVNSVANIANQIVQQYREKGYYTFKDRNEIICKATYASK